jgi:hypothetical protein
MQSLKKENPIGLVWVTCPPPSPETGLHDKRNQQRYVFPKEEHRLLSGKGEDWVSTHFSVAKQNHQIKLYFLLFLESCHQTQSQNECRRKTILRVRVGFIDMFIFMFF